MTLLRRLYRLWLLAYPRAIRRRDGDEMSRQFAAELEAARGPASRIGIGLRAAVDAIWHGLLARLSVRWSVSARRADRRAEPAQGRRRAYWRDGLLADARLAVRRLAASPGFTGVAVVTLALGIGANTAIVSVVHGVLLRPLPYPEPDALISLHHVWEGDRQTLSPPNFLDLQARARTVRDMGAYDGRRRVLTGHGEPLPLAVTDVSRGFFEALRTPPLHGRTFAAGEHETGGTHVVVLSHGTWRDRFAADPTVVGRTIELDGQPWTIVGVMPAAFDWPLGTDMWSPAEYDEAFRATNRGAWYLDAVGRLAPGATIDDARAEFAAIAAQLEREHPDNNARVGLAPHPLLDTLVGDARRALIVLLAAVGLVLLIACANVANLLLARASARRDEMAVRLALGAGRGDLVRQMLIEGLVLAGAGGAAGVAIAIWATRALAALPVEVPRLSGVEVNGTVALVMAGATLATGLLFSLAPAWIVSGGAIAAALRHRGRAGADGAGGRRTRSGLVIAEVALAVMLLAGAGLLGRSFVKLSAVDPGFDTAGAVTFRVSLPAARYPDDARRIAFHESLAERLAAVPGVSATAAVLAIPPSGRVLNLSFEVAGRPPDPPGTDPTLEVSVADAGYFGVMGIPVLRGRGFTRDDRAGTPPVLVLTRSAVERYFPGEDPIGQHVTLGWHRGDGPVAGDVVGVVDDVRGVALDEAAPAQVYVPLAQVPIGSTAVVARTSLALDRIMPDVRRVVADLDAALPLTDVGTLEEHIRASIADRRLVMSLLVSFAAVALGLAAIGVFGVLSYLVSQRAREIGVRMALGASRASVVGLVVRRAMLLAGAGVLLGSGGAAALSGTLEALLFDLSPGDPVTYAAAAAGLMLVAGVAAWLPARRAARVDPLRALRSE